MLFAFMKSCWSVILSVRERLPPVLCAMVLQQAVDSNNLVLPARAGLGALNINLGFKALGSSGLERGAQTVR